MRLIEPRRSDIPNRSEELTSAVIEHWSVSTESALSVRNLSSSVGASASAIGYHFGGLEQLYVKASRQALGEARLWIESVLGDLAPLRERPVTTAVRASVIATTIDRWTSECALAMAWRRTKSFPATEEAAAVQAAWDATWISFWSELAGVIGMGSHAATLAAFADGQACRHLLGSKPVLDACLLQETVHALVSWLDVGRIADDGCRLAYRASATASFAEVVGHGECPACPFGSAAADLLARKGRSGLTFRAVAKEAGSTLGAVSHHFGSKSNLLREALYRLYEREAMEGGWEVLVQRTIPTATLLDEVVGAIAPGKQSVLEAYDEIELAIYNDPEFTDLRAAVRCMNDPTGTWMLKNLLGGHEPSQSLVAAFSSVCRGAGHFVATSAERGTDPEVLVRSALDPFCVG